MDISNITTYQSGVVQAAAYRSLNKHFAALLSEHGLSCMQWFMVGTIYDAGTAGIKLTDLAGKLQTGLPFITNTINLLESKGIILRRDSPTDNRSKLASLNPDFEPQLLRIEHDLRRKLRQSVYGMITPDDLRTYIKVLYQLSDLT